MNYTDLVAAAIAYIDRQDAEVDAQVSTFILMAEARINRLLKTRMQSARVQMILLDGVSWYPVPADYSGVRQAEIMSYNPEEQLGGAICNIDTICQLYYLTPEQVTNKANISDPSSKNYFSVEANQLHIFPVPEITATKSYLIELLYYQNLPNLNVTDSTNWMSDEHPDMYLAGICAEIELFTKNYEAAIGWSDRLRAAIRDLANADEISRWSGSNLTIKSA